MNTLKRFMPLLGMMGVVAYLCFHSWVGDQGLRNSYQIKSDIAETRSLLEQTRNQRLGMEDRVSRLKDQGSGQGIDVDYLEERSRAVLRFAHPDEIVVDIDTLPMR